MRPSKKEQERDTLHKALLWALFYDSSPKEVSYKLLLFIVRDVLQFVL